MAGITVPANLRPALSAIAKYHFWILAMLVPLVLGPLLFMGAASLQQDIAAQRRQIESKIGQARSVTSVQSHPNENWVTAINTDTEAVQRETLDEWRRFWHSQRGLRTWPTELGDQFLQDVAALKPGGTLNGNSLRQYWEKTKSLARRLPARMGVKDEMVDAERGGGGADVAGPGGGTATLEPPLKWSATSQQKLYASFANWPSQPSTTQVVLAQEELWVYGMFCDLLNGFVKSSGATGAHDSPLTLVDELAVGFPAAFPADQTRARQRILLPQSATGAIEGLSMMEPPPGAEAAGQTPWHPRFTSRSGQPSGAPAGGPQAVPADDDFRGWIYVDFDGKPLSAAELAAAPALKMIHLMPFVLRVVVDQRQLDHLLATIAASPIPIDVREVRVNPGAGADGAQAGGALAPRAEAPGQAGEGRQQGLKVNDLVVELRGTVALAAPPDDAPATTEAAP